MAIIQQFRTAMRGFNRQDVQDYIEQMSAVHRQELAELQKRLDKSESRVAELEVTASGIGIVADEAARSRAALEEANQTVSRLRGELSQSESKLAVAKQELERLQAQFTELEPMAASCQELKERLAAAESMAAGCRELKERLAATESMAAGYQELKERFAAVELEAQRAKAAVSEARAESDRIRTDARLCLNRVLEQYSQLRRGMDGVVEQLRTLDEPPKAVQTAQPRDESLWQFRDPSDLK